MHIQQMGSRSRVIFAPPPLPFTPVMRPFAPPPTPQQAADDAMATPAFDPEAEAALGHDDRTRRDFHPLHVNIL